MKTRLHRLSYSAFALIGLLVGLSSCGSDSKSSGGGNEGPTTSVTLPYQGCGSTSTGGHGGSVYWVTTLEDDASNGGSLRFVLNKKNESKIILFKVSGTIELKSPLKISGNTTIYGQSAPGDGICISGASMSGKDHLVAISGDNVIVQFLRFRLANTSIDADAFNCVGHKNILIDHCSFSWSTDECASLYENENLTLQWCLVYEGLNTDMKGNHGFGGIWGGRNVTFHHNLIANQSNRCPRFDHQYAGGAYYGPIDFVNNVIYIAKGGNGTYGGESCNTTGEQRKINFVNNYYRYNDGVSSGKYRIMNPTTSCSNCTDHCDGSVRPPLLYVTGNYVDGSATNTANNWLAISPATDAMKSTTAFPMAIEMTSKQTAEEAYTSVIAHVGASYRRDAADMKVINNVINNDGVTVSGSGDISMPVLSSEPSITDSDNDGMSNEWETAHGLNPSSAADAKQLYAGTSLTNLEFYMYDLVKHLY